MKKLIKSMTVLLVALIALPGVISAQVPPQPESVKKYYRSHRIQKLPGTVRVRRQVSMARESALRADIAEKKAQKNEELVMAAKEGDLEKVKRLVESGANVNEITTKGHTTPLFNAALYGHLDIVVYLVENVAKVNKRSGEHDTALHGAAAQGHLDIVKYLVERDADTNVVDLYGDTPLSLASERGDLDTVTYLVENGANINIDVKKVYKPLLSAAAEGHLDIVKYLVEHGADVNAKSYRGETTALSLAIAGGHDDVAQYLVENGAE